MTSNRIARGFASTALALASCASQPAVLERAAHVPLLQYTLRLADPRQRIVDVEARFEGLAHAPTRIELTMPEGFAFVRLKEPLLEGDLRATDAKGRPLEVERTGAFSWKLERGDVDEVRLTWRVPVRFHDIPEVAERGSYEFPYIDDDHAYLATAALLLTPTLEFESKPRVRFVTPAGWNVFCPWPRASDGWYEPASKDELTNDLVGLGRWSSRRIEAGGMTIDAAFAPGQEALAELAGPAIEKIVRTELDLFGRTPRERYLFLFVKPRAVQGFSCAGSPRTGSMTLQVCGDVTNPIALEMVAHLVAHEFHHTWAQAGCDMPDELRFVNEGFTDWFAFQVPRSVGLVTRERLAEQLGEKIKTYVRASKDLGLSLAEAGGPKFFEGGASYDTVYAGGTLIAALLDLELRKSGRTDGLDGFLRRFINDDRWWPHRRAPTLDEFLAQVEAETSRAVRERLERCVRSPSGFDARAELTQSGASIESRAEPRSPRANFEGTRITALDPNGEGYAAGLRVGDEVISVNGIEAFDAASIERAWRQIPDGQFIVELERGGAALEVRATVESSRKTLCSMPE